MQDTLVKYLGWEDPLEKELATHSSILAWRIPWTKEPGRLQSMGSQRVGHGRVTVHEHSVYIYILFKNSFSSFTCPELLSYLLSLIFLVVV